MPRLARRSLVAGLLAAIGRPAAGQVQRRIAIAHSGVPAGQLTEGARGTLWVHEFFVTLRRLGYEEGRNLVVERYSAEGHPERFAAIAHEVVRRSPEVIVANLTEFVDIIRKATSTIPIVAIVGDPLRSGLVSSLARPGGNLTGVSSDAGIEFFAKGLQILKEAVPSAAQVGYLALAGGAGDRIDQTLQHATQRLGLTIVGLYPQEITERSLRDAFADAGRRRLDAVIVGSEGTLLAHRALIVELAAHHRLPTLYPYRDYAELGGLLAYAPDLDELGQRMADDVARILGGAKPGDIPFWLPTRIQLVVNMKAARTLGLTLPPTVLAQAESVIE